MDPSGFLAVITVATSLYFLAVMLAFIFQRNMMFFPSREWRGTPAMAGLNYAEVFLHTEDGVDLSAWWIESDKEEFTVLLCHGNAGNISDRLDTAQRLNSLGLSVLLFDYRGYGKSGGRITEKGLYLDAEAAWHHLREVRGKSAKKVVVLGKSLGGPIAARLAAKVEPAGLILQSTFTSASDLASNLYWWLPVRLLLRFRFPTMEFLKDVGCPVLVVHSLDDEIVPFKHGKKLVAASPDPKALLEIRGGHNEAMFVDSEAYSAGVQAFLSALSSR